MTYDWRVIAAHSLVLSVAVVSMKMFLVLPGTILESAMSIPQLEGHVAGLTLRIDDGRHGEDTILRVVDDGVGGSVSDQVQVAAQMTVVLNSSAPV